MCFSENEINDLAPPSILANSGGKIKTSEAIKILDLKGNYKKIYAITNFFNVYRITITPHGDYYEKKEIEKIKKIIDELYENNKKMYYAPTELIEMGFEHHELKLFQKENLTLPEKMYEFEKAMYKYPKSFVHNVQKQLQSQNQIETYSTLEVSKILDLPNNYILLEYLNINKITPIKKRNSPSFQWRKKDIETLVSRKKHLEDTFFENNVGKNRFSKFINMSWAEIERCTGLNISFDKFPSELRKSKFKNEEYCLDRENLKHLIEKLLEKHSFLVLTQETIRKLNKFKSDITWGIFKCNKKKIIERSRKETTSPDDIQKIFGFKEDFYKQIKSYHQTEDNQGIKKFLISKKDILKKYNITSTAFNNIESFLELPEFTFGNTSFYPSQGIADFFEKALKEQDELLSNYYTINQLKKMGLLHRDLSKIGNWNKTPEHVKFGRIKNTKFFSKIESDKIIMYKKMKEISLKYKKKIAFTTLPGQIFIEIINEIKKYNKHYYFSENAKFTEDTWFNFAQEHINKSEGNSETIFFLINNFLELNELLMEVTKEKDIIKMSTNEINTKIFNSGLSLYNLQHLNKFLRILEEKYETKYLSNKFINLLELIKRNKKSLSKKVYSVEEYLKLVDYVCDIELHRNNVFKELDEIEIGKTSNKFIKYREYESVWLYIILHLNNAWRSKDFIYKIPRINLPNGVNSIEELKKFELNKMEADKIISELAANIVGTRHNKNNKEAYFFCSEEMKLPLAHAVILCELKCRMYRPTNNHLIKLTEDDKLNSTLNNKFFENFEIDGFVFRSLSANRSFITIINMTLKKLTNRNPLELTKYLRNHHSINMTNTYIHITEEDLNRVSKTLFNTGFFGYTYDLLLKSVLEIDSTTQLNLYDPKDYEFIKSIFGDMVQIENKSIYMNHLNNYASVYEYINDLESQKKVDLLTFISLEQLPAKEKYWQCILGNCIYGNRSCSSCPLAIPHMYILTTILENLDKHLSEYESDLDDLFGEKRRLANLIYKNLLILSAAKKKFGEEILNIFLGYKYSELKNRIRNLSNFDKYLSIKGAFLFEKFSGT